MLEIKRGADGSVMLCGRFDAASEHSAREAFEQLSGAVVIDCRQLRYISSAGIGVLFATHRRLVAVGGGLELQGLSPHIHEMLVMTGFAEVLPMARA
ncbi:MAG TPA: STAS domain-containing protein [Thermoanaerobaculia bacterium]|nr:STAS domain-containing protein [Thermoanaerobaculia bacterium]